MVYRRFRYSYEINEHPQSWNYLFLSLGELVPKRNTEHGSVSTNDLFSPFFLQSDSQQRSEITPGSVELMTELTLKYDPQVQI
jgi:hypothetical protein